MTSHNLFVLECFSFFLSTHPAELFDAVRAKSDKARAARAGLNALHSIIGGGVRPQQVHEHDATLLHGQRPLQLLNLADCVDRATNACTAAQLLKETASQEIISIIFALIEPLMV